MAEESFSHPSFSPHRKWRIGLSVMVSVIVLIAVVGMVNFIAARHFKRVHWDPAARFQLAPLTIQVLGKLTNQVKVVVLFDRTNDLFGTVSELLRQYQNKSSLITVEDVDYMRATIKTQNLITQYKLLPVSSGDRVIFISNGHTEVVYAKDLSIYDYSAAFRGEDVKRTGFKGEQLFTSAIYNVANPRSIKAYFLIGHREHDWVAADNFGYLFFKQLLEENSITTDRTNLMGNDVPEDCQLLIVAGPMDRFQAVEIERIEKYLNQGGRLFVLFNGQAREPDELETLLAKWGVEVGRNQVRGGKTDGASVVIAMGFDTHPIMAALGGGRLVFGLPRSIQRRAASQGADQPKVVELAHTDKAGIAVWAVGPKEGATQREGEIPLCVAVEKGNIPGVSLDRGATRLVVAGDSLFLSNIMIDQGSNRDFARNAVNWLINRDALLEGIGAHPVKEYQITLTPSEMKTVQWIFLAGFPGTALFAGLVVWLRRRS